MGPELAEQHAAHMERRKRLSTPPPAPQTNAERWEAALAAHPRREAPQGEMGRILRVVADDFGFDVNDLRGPHRMADHVLPRHIAMYLTKKRTMLSLPQIGRHYGDRDHSTILYAVRKIENAKATDIGLADTIARLDRKLSGQ